MHKGSHMHTCSAAVCLPHAVFVTQEKSLEPYFLPKQKRKKKRSSYVKHTGNVWVTASMCVCVWLFVYVCTCPLVWSSAWRARDQFLVIACLWFLPLSRLQLQLQSIKTLLKAESWIAQQKKNWSCEIRIGPKPLPQISQIKTWLNCIKLKIAY